MRRVAVGLVALIAMALPVRPAARAISPIDDLVSRRLAALHLTPAPVASDDVFLRRVYLDTIGTLPTSDEAREFLSSTDSGKRPALIDRLLARDEFADYWAMKWSDLLRVKSEFPINLWPNAVQAYHHWIRTSVRDNVPYDQFVRTLLTESGSNFRSAPVNFYRAVDSRDPSSLARAVALTFMGVRADRWPPERLAAMSAFFAKVAYKSTGEWKEEIVYFDSDKGAVGRPPESSTLTFPDGATTTVSRDQDPRRVFAAWLIRAENPWFTRNIANRVWSWLLGRGVVHEPDDIRPDNPPTNPELLAYLERELIAARYDVKHLFRLILNSDTYQREAAADDNPDESANFAHYIARPLDAEVLIDAICQITGVGEEYSSAIPEPFTFMPSNQRAIALADGSITSTFLDIFGRPPRDTGLESERSARPTAAARLYLLNSSGIQRKLQQSQTLQSLLASNADWRQTIATLYLTMLSRMPTAKELAIASSYAQSSGANRRQLLLDLAWALMNSQEFLYRH